MEHQRQRKRIINERTWHKYLRGFEEGNGFIPQANESNHWLAAQLKRSYYGGWTPHGGWTPLDLIFRKTFSWQQNPFIETFPAINETHKMRFPMSNMFRQYFLRVYTFNGKSIQLNSISSTKTFSGQLDKAFCLRRKAALQILDTSRARDRKCTIATTTLRRKQTKTINHVGWELDVEILARYFIAMTFGSAYSISRKMNGGCERLLGEVKFLWERFAAHEMSRCATRKAAKIR